VKEKKPQIVEKVDIERFMDSTIGKIDVFIEIK